MQVAAMEPDARPVMARGREAVLRLGCALVRGYFRAPGAPGRRWLWKNFVQRHVVWRGLRIAVPARDGFVIAGRLDDLIHRYLYFFGVFEPGIARIFRDALRPGDIAIDVGANVGVHTLLAATLVGPQGRVHAIEASPHIHRQLRANLAANGASQVVTYNLAATDAPCSVPVFLHDSSNIGRTTIMADIAAENRAAAEAEVEGRPLQDIVPQADLAAAKLIKIDVEGAEWLVVQGMRAMLGRLHPDVRILVEVTPQAIAQSGGTLRALVEIFAEAGFEAFEVPNRYDEEFYFDSPDLTPRPLASLDVDLADILFRRRAAV